MSSNILKYVRVLAALSKDGILTDKKDFTCQIGEWLVEQHTWSTLSKRSRI